jgi:Na+/proline symporter
MTPILWGLIVYIAVQVAIGFLVSRRIHNNEDYVLAGRRLGYGLGTFTIFATWFGAETCLGAAGQAYERGLEAAEVDPLGYTLCLFLLGLVYASRLWKGKFLTLGDFFKQRYSRAVECLAIALLVPTSVLWAGAQLRAFGTVLSEASILSVEFSIVIATVVVLLYTVSGGMMADAITDLVQGIMLILGLSVLAYAVLSAHGGIEALESIPPDRLRLFGEPGRPWPLIINAWAVPVLNAIVSQELIARTLASKSPSVARNNCLLAGGLYLTAGAMPFVLGLIGPNIVPGLADPEQILTVLARTYLSDLLFVLFAGAIVSALLSTIDSALLVSASLMSHNLLGFVVRNSSDMRQVNWSRVWVVLLGLAAYGATFLSDSIFDLVQEAGQFGASGLFVVITFGLFTGFGGPWSAGISMIVGIGVYTGTKFASEDFPGFLVTLLASLVSYIASAGIEQNLKSRGRTRDASTTQ